MDWAPGRAGRLLLAACLSAPASAQDDCVKQCSFNNRLQKCVTNRGFVAELLAAYGTNASRRLSQTLQDCESTELSACSGVCALDESDERLCTVSRTWAVQELLVNRSQEGLDLGPDRCGLLGEFLERSRACGQRDSSACEDNADLPLAQHCSWNAAANGCEVSRKAMVSSIRTGYHNVFARAQLTREGCSTRSSNEALCLEAPECRWTGSSCAVRTELSLVHLAGEDCPLRMLLQRQSQCDDAGTDREACESKRRIDGLPMCVFAASAPGVPNTGSRCEAHPSALEYDLMLLFGDARNRRVRELLKKAQSDCDTTSAGSCENTCAPALAGSSALAPSMVTTLLLSLFAVDLFSRA